MTWKPTAYPNGISTAGGLQVGAQGSVLAAIRAYTPALSPAAVAAGTTAEQIVAVTGLNAGDIVLGVNKPTAQAGLGIVGARVAATNELAITFANTTAAEITPTAGESYSLVVVTPGAG